MGGNIPTMPFQEAYPVTNRILLLAICSTTLWAQGGFGGPPNREAGVTPVPFERILGANQEPQNWLTFSGNLNSQRHSGLTQINPTNARDLSLKWVFQSRSLDKHEVTPLVVDGIMYTVQSPNDVFALDATTGKTIWSYAHKPAEGTRNPCCGNLTRGLAILGDKLFLAALDAKMIALDAKTGRELWTTQVADYKQQYAMTVAPIVIKDKVISGVAGGEHGVRGFLAAFDVNTGKEVWRFNTVPGPGEAGYETWLDKNGKPSDAYLHGGAPIWVTGSYDPATNLTMWGTGNAGPDYNGENRPGDNLYSSSVIALDADTGKLKWYYQFSPHDEFDWDATQVPVLADIDFGGAPRKVMMWANRNGVFYVLDRTSGQFLSGKSFTKTNWYTGFDEKGRPMRAAGILPSKEGTLVYPGNQGGTNWYNPSFSPAYRLVLYSGMGEQLQHLPQGRRPARISGRQELYGTRARPRDDQRRRFQLDHRDGPEDQRAEMDVPVIRAFNRRRGAHDSLECSVRRRTRWTICCAGRA